jgi:hypothetical protein
LAPERFREAIVRVVKSLFIEQVGFQTIQTFEPYVHCLKYAHKKYFIAEPARWDGLVTAA